MDLNINRVVIILNNNSAQVMNEKDIKQSIRIYVTKVYDKENSTVQQLKEKISISKIEKLIINAHTSWYSHLIKDNDKSYDLQKCQLKRDMKGLLHQLIHLMEDIVY